MLSERASGPAEPERSGRQAAWRRFWPVAALLILLVRLARSRPALSAAVAVATLAADLLYTNHPINPTAPVELFATRPPLVEAAGSGSSHFRIDSDLELVGTALPVRPGWSEQALTALEMRLTLLYGAALDGVRDARDTSPNKLFTPEFLEHRRRVRQWTEQRRHALLGRLNIRYFITPAGPAPPPSLHQVAVVQTLTRRLAVWEIEDWRPRVELPGGTARIVEEFPAEVAVRAESAAAGTLLLRDRYDRGWRARLDGAPISVEPSEDGFRAVRLPPGRHTVRFFYRPWTFLVGASISAAAFLLLVLLALGEAPSRRSSKTPAGTQPSPGPA